MECLHHACKIWLDAFDMLGYFEFGLCMSLWHEFGVFSGIIACDWVLDVGSPLELSFEY